MEKKDKSKAEEKQKQEKARYLEKYLNEAKEFTGLTDEEFKEMKEEFMEEELEKEEPFVINLEDHRKLKRLKKQRYGK